MTEVMPFLQKTIFFFVTPGLDPEGIFICILFSRRDW